MRKGGRRPRDVEILEIVGTRMRALRGDRSQQEWADFLDMDRRTIGFYEEKRREPTLRYLRQIAMKAGVSTDYLLGLTNDPTGRPCDLSWEEQMDALLRSRGLSDEERALVLGYIKAASERRDKERVGST